MSVLYFELLIIELYIATVKPLYNGQVGAGAFVFRGVLYSEVWAWLITKIDDAI